MNTFQRTYFNKFNTNGWVQKKLKMDAESRVRFCIGKEESVLKCIFSLGRCCIYLVFQNGTDFVFLRGTLSLFFFSFGGVTPSGSEKLFLSLKLGISPAGAQGSIWDAKNRIWISYMRAMYTNHCKPLWPSEFYSSCLKSPLATDMKTSSK